LRLTLSNGGENLALAHKYLGGLYMSAGQEAGSRRRVGEVFETGSEGADAERIKGTIKDLRNQ
jgi:hypothetical protein